MKKIKKTVVLTEHLINKMNQETERNGHSISTIITIALENYLPKDKKSKRHKPLNERRVRWAYCKPCDVDFEPLKSPNCPKCDSSAFQVISYYAD